VRRTLHDVSSVEVFVGRVGKPHGIKGEVTVDVRTDEPDRRFAPGARLRVEAPRGSASTLTTIEVESSRWHQGVLLVRFTGLGTRNDAETVRGLLLHTTLDLEDRPEDPEEFYDHQLIGLAAYDLDGALLGEVTTVVHGAAQDLLGIRTPDRRDTLVPFVAELVPEVDLEARRVVVADRPGLVAPFPDDAPTTDPSADASTDTPATGA